MFTHFNKLCSLHPQRRSASGHGCLISGPGFLLARRRMRWRKWDTCLSEASCVPFSPPLAFFCKLRGTRPKIPSTRVQRLICAYFRQVDPAKNTGTAVFPPSRYFSIPIKFPQEPTPRGPPSHQKPQPSDRSVHSQASSRCSPASTPPSVSGTEHPPSP